MWFLGFIKHKKHHKSHGLGLRNEINIMVKTFHSKTYLNNIESKKYNWNKGLDDIVIQVCHSFTISLQVKFGGFLNPFSRAMTNLGSKISTSKP
jgi:hypothetical protein